jgi:hypothetical protein
MPSKPRSSGESSFLRWLLLLRILNACQDHESTKVDEESGVDSRGHLTNIPTICSHDSRHQKGATLCRRLFTYADEHLGYRPSA